MLRTLVVGVFAGLFMAGLVLVVFINAQPGATPAAAQKTVSVIAAAHALRAGSLLQPGDLTAQNVPGNQLPAGSHADTTEARNALVGAMVRRMMGEHEVIAADDVLRPGDRGFLAAVLRPGTRAVSVAVDSVSGEAGLIWPGDRVDLILTQTIEGNDQSLAHRVAGETVLGDVRVIAVDQQLVQGGQASGLLEGRTPSSRTITLEVTPQDAARIAVATRLGKLQVVLRAAQPDALEAAVHTAAAAAVQALSTAPASIPASSTPAPTASAITASAPPPSHAPDNATTVWGGDVSHALAPEGRAHSPEVRLFDGAKPAETYKF
jgi:pilus assembly protein CpaB